VLFVVEPLAGEPDGNGKPDPTSGKTGLYVYGYNLSGNYKPDLPERHLTTGPINCTGLTQVELRFYRWLGVEGFDGIFGDRAYISVSNDRINWTTVWENPEDNWSDAEWQPEPNTFNISSIADGQPTVYIRWTMGPTDSGWNWCGWNIDDVEIWAEEGCPKCSGGTVILNGTTFPSGKTCGCTGTTISLLNVTVPNNATVNFTASTSITVGAGTTFENGSNATLTSPRTTFQPGSHIENGAVVRVKQ